MRAPCDRALCDPGAETLAAPRGSAPPFLPTLVTALAIGGLSLLCRAPSAPETPASPIVAAQASPAGADGFHPAMPAEALPAVPAALVFARLHPLTLQVAEAETVRAPAARPSRAAAARRTCPGARCGETRRLDTAARAAPPVKAASEPAAVPEPMRGQREPDEDLVPAGALPFAASAAATASSWVDGARKIGGSIGGSVSSGATSLGGSVVDLVASAL